MSRRSEKGFKEKLAVRAWFDEDAEKTGVHTLSEDGAVGSLGTMMNNLPMLL